MTRPVLETFRRLRAFPGGAFAFDMGLAMAAPFNIAVAPQVSELRRGRAVVVMRDRSWRRNHLGSIHAMALGTLAEITANLALLASLPPGARMIPTSFDIEFSKKARGTITAVTAFDESTLDARPSEIVLTTQLADAHDVVVARAQQTCRLKWAS